MNTSKKTAKKSRLQIESNMNAGVGYACVNEKTGDTVFSGSTNNGQLLDVLGGMCRGYHYTFMMY